MKTGNNLKVLVVVLSILIVLPVVGFLMLLERHSFHATVRGQITDSQSVAISDANVRLFVSGSDGGSSDYEVKTDSNGQYFIQVPTIRYALDTSGRGSLYIKAQGYIPVSVNRPVSKGIHTNWNFQLTPAITVAGRVVNTKDEPMSNTQVNLLLFGQDKDAELRYRSAYGRTDQNGYFSFDTVGPFQYRVLIDCHSDKLYRQNPVNGNTLDLADPKQRNGYEIRIHDPHDYTISGVVTDEQGNRLAEAWVWINGNQGGTWGTYTDPNGEFSIIGLDGHGTGPYDVHVKYRSPEYQYFQETIPGVPLHSTDLELIVPFNK